MAKPFVYLVLGCKGSDQFRVVSDLIEFGTAKEEKTAFFHSANDADEVAADFSIKNRETAVAAYGYADGVLSFDVPEETDLAFVVADGLEDPSNVRSVSCLASWKWL